MNLNKISPIPCKCIDLDLGEFAKKSSIIAIGGRWWETVDIGLPDVMFEVKVKGMIQQNIEHLLKKYIYEKLGISEIK